jgi:hypothetical protein
MKTTSNFKNTPAAFAPIVDRLAEIKAQLAELSKTEEELKHTLIESGFDAIDGALLRATISHVDGRVTVDWATIAAKFNPSPQLVNAHTKQGAPYVVVRLAARKQ